MPVDHYENFPVASLLLPAHLRPAVADIYRFARSADDIADEGDADDAARLAALRRYSQQLDHIGAQPPLSARADAPTELAAIFVPLAATIREHRLALAPFHRLLSAFMQDVTVKRYEDFTSLLDYCMRSAAPVGEIMLGLYRADTPDNLALSDAICNGLQLVNFWQDVALDWQKQRIYLPQADLRRFGVTEAGIAAGRIDDAWRALMRFELDRARALLHFGAPLAWRLPGRIGWELRLVVQGGLRILERIESAEYDVFHHRPTLGKADWLLMAWRACRMPHTLPVTASHYDA